MITMARRSFFCLPVLLQTVQADSQNHRLFQLVIRSEFPILANQVPLAVGDKEKGILNQHTQRWLLENRIVSFDGVDLLDAIVAFAQRYADHSRKAA
jgi:hypothetical protein